MAALAFAQTAVAMFACTVPDLGEIKDCSEASHESSVLCKAHCQPDKQNLDQARTPVIPPLSAPVLAVVPNNFGAGSESVVFQCLLPRTGSPPLPILHCSLLI